MHSDEPKLVNAHGLAIELLLPRDWLVRQADAGAIPCLRIGRAYLFEVGAVRRALAGIAARTWQRQAAATSA